MGTKIDAAAVAQAGAAYSTVGDNLGTAVARIRGFSAAPGDFGATYAAEGAAYGTALEGLARAVEAWRDGARACGRGLTASATVHRATDVDGATTIVEG